MEKEETRKEETSLKQSDELLINGRKVEELSLSELSALAKRLAELEKERELISQTEALIEQKENGNAKQEKVNEEQER